MVEWSLVMLIKELMPVIIVRKFVNLIEKFRFNRAGGLVCISYVVKKYLDGEIVVIPSEIV